MKLRYIVIAGMLLIFSAIVLFDVLTMLLGRDVVMVLIGLAVVFLMMAVMILSFAKRAENKGKRL